jgi:hypothetical protein
MLHSSTKAYTHSRNASSDQTGVWSGYMMKYRNHNNHGFDATASPTIFDEVALNVAYVEDGKPSENMSVDLVMSYAAALKLVGILTDALDAIDRKLEEREAEPEVYSVI